MKWDPDKELSRLEKDFDLKFFGTGISKIIPDQRSPHLYRFKIKTGESLPSWLWAVTVVPAFKDGAGFPGGLAQGHGRTIREAFLNLRKGLNAKLGRPQKRKRDSPRKGLVAPDTTE